MSVNDAIILSSTPRDRACSSTSRSSSERPGQPHFWWQIVRLHSVTAEGASCAARAFPSEGMQTTRTARCVPADHFPDGVPGTGREPSSWASSVSPATRRRGSQKILRKDKYGLLSPEAASDSDCGPGADSDCSPGGDHQLGNKTGFPPRTWPYPHAVPSAAARKTQGARAHPPIPLDRPGGTPTAHSGRFPPLTAADAASYLGPSNISPKFRKAV